MTARSTPLAPPSPILPDEEVERILIEALGNLGAAGGALGGSVRGPAAAAGGYSGGRVGARWGTKRFTRTFGDSRVLNVPLTPEMFDALHAALPQIVLSQPEVGRLVGVVGSGSMRMNPTVVQAVWQPGRLYLTAHAREGLIKQRTAPKALDRLAETLPHHA